MTETPHPERPADRQPLTPADDADPEAEGSEQNPAYSSDEEAEVAARLESLGYM